jgi:hypothetical protein
VRVSTPGSPSVTEHASQIGNYVQIEFPANSRGRASVVLQTRADMPEKDPLAPRYNSSQRADIRKLVTDVSAGFLNGRP